MPIYQYQCIKCNLIIEETRRITDNSDYIVCSCGSPANKIISPCTFILKGEGWAGKDAKKKK